jgi:ATPase subunit of ABC transporter with duplicated ATPase domains
MEMNRMTEKKKKVRIGLIGHVDHGKTTLAATIIKALDDTHVEIEEKSRTEFLIENAYQPPPPMPILFEKKGRRRGQRNHRRRR